jgi:auxin influx carrier (AUX1 LAX family)
MLIFIHVSASGDRFHSDDCCSVFPCKKKYLFLQQNAAEKPPFFLPSWTGMFVLNMFIVVWVLVVGFGLGGWASMVNFVRQIDTFGLFAKCYQCPKPPVPAAAQSPAPLPHH